jgi:hypothetical protein
LLRHPWYESEKARLRDPVIIAQELDIDYTASLEGVTIPAKWVQAAVDLKLPDTGPVIAGLDVADGGGALSVLTVRCGPVIKTVFSRAAEGTTDTAYWALDLARNHGAAVLNYDAVGVGAGVGGVYLAAGRSGNLGLMPIGVNVGQPPTETKWPDGNTSKQKFTNLKAELWWTVRRRFEKTFEYVEDGVEYPLDELISIPNDPNLIRQISNVLHYTTETGKIQIEKKEQLARRGVASPDYAESLMLTFVPADPTTRIAAPLIVGARTR